MPEQNENELRTSMEILRFADAIQAAADSIYEEEGASGRLPYSSADYENLLNAHIAINQSIPLILKHIRARSVDSERGWRFSRVDAANGDFGLCAICKLPFQHFDLTVKVHCIDMHENAYHGVCRDCVGEYAPLEFVEQEGVGDWLKVQTRQSGPENEKRNAFIDAIRRHAGSTHYFTQILENGKEWINDIPGEWR